MSKFVSNVEIFESFAAAFEASVEDDDWSRLEKYLADDATYLNVGGPDPKCEGRKAIIAYLQADVTNTDRCFDSRTLVALTQPKAEGDRLSRQWCCTYTLAGAPDLVVEGEARYLFERDLIKEIEEEITTASAQRLEDWMQKYGEKLAQK
jgi:hypothetical protein